MTDAELDAIEVRAKTVTPNLCFVVGENRVLDDVVRKDIPALVAEVRRVKKLLVAHTVIHKVKKVITKPGSSLWA